MLLCNGRRSDAGRCIPLQTIEVQRVLLLASYFLCGFGRSWSTLVLLCVKHGTDRSVPYMLDRHKSREATALKILG